MTDMPPLYTALMKLKDKFESSQKWSPQATDWEKGLVAGNLNGFCSFLAEQMPKEIVSDFPLRDKCESKARALDMPHFTLIASDNFACDIVALWIERADENGNGLPDEKYKEAKALLTAMRDWRVLNADKCKNPD